MSRLEDEILREVHTLDPEPMSELLSHEEKVKLDIQRQQMEHAKLESTHLNTRGYAALKMQVRE